MKTRSFSMLALTASIFAAAGSIAASSAELDLSTLPKVSQLPKNVVQVSPVIPNMGAHYADPKTLPFGPIYCVISGRVVCMEYMVSQKDFAKGKSFTDLAPWFDGAQQPAINHMEFQFNPKGHPGYEIPHYDVHMYFVSKETLALTTKQASK
jgi:hypothetical protein